MKRREFLTAGALAAGGVLLRPRVAFAGTREGMTARFVFIILRGALDGVAAVPPYGDPAYAAQRDGLALAAPGADSGALALDGFFGLHPAFVFMQQAYAARELIVFHAVASPYRERSHFDGQNVLETGYAVPHAVHTGWLNRALAAVPSGRAPENARGVSISPTAPLVLQGDAPVMSWSPSRLAPLDDDTLRRITELYSRDPLLATRLTEALAAQTIAEGGGASVPSQATTAVSADRMASSADTADESMGSPGAAHQPLLAMRGDPGDRYAEVVRASARFLRQDNGPQVAVFDTTGWDTHFNEGGAKGQLAARLGTLDRALALLKSELGPVWKDTAVLLATEFGRTVAENGTQGTDHGTATAAYLLGGAVRGGRVVADWPGLSQAALYQRRDLRATLDLRSVLKGVLDEHLRVPARALENSVFPGSADARPLTGLMA